MGNGRLHELYLSSGGVTTTQLHHIWRRNPRFHLQPSSIMKAVVGFLKSTLASGRSSTPESCTPSDVGLMRRLVLNEDNKG